jgi:hypothetical protein
MPPEKVTGLSNAGAQHWNAWMIDEDAWGHIDPVAQSLADNLASSYLRPAARDAGFAAWQTVCVGYDPAGILTNPDSFADAIQLYDKRAVGKEYLRAAGNATDEDAMEDWELEEAVFVETGQRVEFVNGEIQEPEMPPALVPGAMPPGEAPQNGNGGPPTGEETPRQAPAIPEGMGMYMLLGAAESTLFEIRARVGSRLRNHLRGRCPDCYAQVRDTKPGEVASTLGPEIVLEHGPDLVSLAIDGARNFMEVAVRMGVSHAQAQALAEVLELHAITSIYDRAPELPAGFMGRVRVLSGASA